MFDFESLYDYILTLTGEDIEEIDFVNFFDDCSARINTELGIDIPLDVNGDNYVFPLGMKWIRILYVPFISGRVKQKESSAFEYQAYFNEFENNLIKNEDKLVSEFEAYFNSRNLVDDEGNPITFTKDPNKTGYAPDFDGSWWI
jgi:hypothetical protein